MAWPIAALLFSLTMNAQPAIEARVRELQSSPVTIKLVDRTVVEGKIVRAGAESFTVQSKKKNAAQVELRYAQVNELRKSGWSRRTKAIVIPAAIGGATLLFFCAAPYPIGFLCRQDPS